MPENKTKDLIKGIASGDRASIEAFYKMHVPVLWPIALRFAIDHSDAKSILNLAMFKIIRALPSFQGNDRALVPWMKSICIHVGIDTVRSRARFSMSIELTLAHEHEIDRSLEDQFSSEEILDLLKKLPEVQRTILVLFAIEGFSHAEIAENLDISENNSRWHLHKARLTFKKLLDQAERVHNSHLKMPKLA